MAWSMVGWMMDNTQPICQPRLEALISISRMCSHALDVSQSHTPYVKHEQGPHVFVVGLGHLSSVRPRLPQRQYPLQDQRLAGLPPDLTVVGSSPKLFHSCSQLIIPNEQSGTCEAHRYVAPAAPLVNP